MRGCQLQQRAQGVFEIKEMLTRGDPKVGGGRQTKSARHLVDLIGSTRRPALIYYACWTHVPAVLQRFTRFASDLDGDTLTTRGRVPI